MVPALRSDPISRRPPLSQESVDSFKRERIARGNARLKRAIDDGAGGIGPWPRRMEAVFGSLLDAVADDPYLAELCLVHGRYLDEAADPFDAGLVEALAGVIRSGRRSGPEPDPGPRAEELVAYGVLAVIAERLQRDEEESLHELTGELSQLVTMPFLEGRDRLPTTS